MFLLFYTTTLSVTPFHVLLTLTKNERAKNITEDKRTVTTTIEFIALKQIKNNDTTVY